MAKAGKFFILLPLSYLVLIFGRYSYMRSDQAIYSLQGMRWASADFCINDWLVESATHYNVLYSWFIYYLRTYDFMEVGFFVLAFLTVALNISGFIHLGKSLRLSDVAIATALLMTALIYRVTLAAMTLFIPFFGPRSVANGFALFAISFAIRKRYAAAAAFCAVCFMFHISLGLILFLTYCGVLVHQNRKNFSAIIRPIGLFAILTLPIMLLANFSLMSSSLSTPLDISVAETRDLFQFIFRWRLPHHYWVTSWTDQWMIFAGVLMPLLIHPGSRKKLTPWTPLIFAGMGLTAILTHVAYIHPLPIRIMYWGMAHSLTVVLILLFSDRVTTLVADRKAWPSACAAVLVIGLLYRQHHTLLLIALTGFMVLTLWTFANTSRWKWTAFTVTSIFYGFALFRHGSDPMITIVYPLIIIIYFVAAQRLAIITRWPYQFATLALVCAALILGAHQGYDRTFKLHLSFPDSAVQQACDWIRSNTPVGSVVAVPPSLYKFQVMSERASVISHKGVALVSPQSIKEWKERLMALTGTNDLENDFPPGPAVPKEMDRRFFALTPEDVLRLRDLYGAQYLLTATQHKYPYSFNANGFDVLYDHANIVVRKIPSPLAMSDDPPSIATVKGRSP